MQFDDLQRQVHAYARHPAGKHSFGVVRIRFPGHHFRRSRQENVVRVIYYIIIILCLHAIVHTYLRGKTQNGL